jgi:transposase-like protein
MSARVLKFSTPRRLQSDLAYLYRGIGGVWIVVRKPLLETPTITANGKTMGKPRLKCPSYPPRTIRQQPPADVYAAIQQMATEHKSLKLIARELGTNPEMLRRWMTDDSQLQWAFESGRAVAEHELKMQMVEAGRENDKLNLNALVMLKCMHGWREGDQGEQASRVNITFNIPAALSREEFLKTVIHEQQRNDDEPVSASGLVRT